MAVSTRTVVQFKVKQHVLEKLPKDAVQYVGIACDEPGRFHVFGDKKKSPLVEAGWSEEYCRNGGG